MSRYTAGDFDRALADWDAEPLSYRGAIEAALAIASNVMRRGEIEDAIFAGPDVNSKLPGSQWRSDVYDLAESIRKALTTELKP